MRMQIVQHIQRKGIGTGIIQKAFTDIHVFTDRLETPFMRHARRIEDAQGKRQLHDITLQVEPLQEFK